jgi:hypothetical protein
MHRGLGAGELPKSATPELFFAHSAELWQRQFGSGEARVRTLGRGYGRLEIRPQAGPQRAAARPPLALIIAMLGILDEGLRSSGGRAPSVRLAECMALGDALDAFEATWRG